MFYFCALEGDLLILVLGFIYKNRLLICLFDNRDRDSSEAAAQRKERGK